MTAAVPAPRRAGRPVRSVLSRERITTAALDLIADAGYEGLTMSALARRLRVAPSALYNHAGSKQEVLGWVQDHVMTMVDFSAFADEPWNEAVRRWAWSYRGVFARHAPLIPVIAVMPITDAAKTLRMYEEVTRGFVRAGWPAGRIIPAIVALESFIYGSALDVAAPGDIFDSGSLADQFPVFTAAARSAAACVDGESPADTAFRTGLDGLIDGLGQQLASYSS
jgi:AcrR family transcriptional regulator